MDLISVIVPVYNVERYLRECLNSILGQTYKNIEVIMVDDGSTDGSGRICDEYARKYPNFTVIHKKNAGGGMARNTGIEHIKGEYVTFVDSDDYIARDLVEKLYNSLKQNNVDVCKSGFQRITDDKQILAIIGYEDEVFAGSEAREVLLPRMVGSRPDKKDSVEMCVCAGLYKTSHIKEHGLRFPSEKELISEDLVFNIDYMQHACGACTISYIGYNYRRNIESLSVGYRRDRFEASKHFYLEMQKKLEQLGYDTMVKYRLQRIFFIYVKMCIAQETPARSKRSCQMNIRKIKDICYDETVCAIVKEYPVHQLGFAQKCFVKLLDWKQYLILYVLARMGKM